MKHHWNEVGTRKKRPASRVFFFLPAFGRCCPSVIANLAKVLLCTQNVCKSNIAIADHFPSKTFSFKHHLTGEAWPGWLKKSLKCLGECFARLSFYRAPRSQQQLTWRRSLQCYERKDGRSKKEDRLKSFIERKQRWWAHLYLNSKYQNRSL